MRSVALLVLAACGGAPVAPPASQEVAVAAPSASTAPCPNGHVESGLCVNKVVAEAPPDRRIGVKQWHAWNRPAPMNPPDVALARQRFSEGLALYQAGDYSGALEKLEGAYAASVAPPILYNIGVCLEQLGRLDEAVDAFEAYLADAPSPRDDVRARIASLKEKIGR
jgi:hypothetical protein